jgi:hypothetical protein
LISHLIKKIKIKIQVGLKLKEKTKIKIYRDKGNYLQVARDHGDRDQDQE